MVRNKKTNIIAVALLVVSLALVIGVDLIRSRNPFYETAFTAMGTDVTVRLHGPGRNSAAEAIAASITREEDEYWSWNKESAMIYRLNAATNSMPADRKTVDMLKEILFLCRDTGGELDLTVGALTKLWGFDTGRHYVPGDDELTEALMSVNFNNVVLDSLNIFVKNNGQIDLGAFGKGIACDTAKAVMDKSRVKGGIVSFGSSILVRGPRPDKDTWSVGIRNPDGNRDEIFAVLELTNCVISTSGAYEKGFTNNGTYYHHILSTKTGKPVKSEFKSVTVVSEKGLLSDALSTACFILGYNDSIPLLMKYNSEAVFVDNENNVYVTRGLRDKLTIKNDNFTIKERFDANSQ